MNCISIVEEGERPLPLQIQEIAESVVEAACACVGFAYPAMVDILLTTDEHIRPLNRQARKVDQATDVLSFPMLSYRQAGDFSMIQAKPDLYIQEEYVLLGDIVISKDRVRSQAEEYGHTMEREYAFLIAHSMLHLFGYDHEQEQEREIMEEKQREIMERVHIGR